LIWCLEHQFGAAFPPELREAWITLYGAVRTEMIPFGKTCGMTAGRAVFFR